MTFIPRLVTSQLNFTQVVECVIVNLNIHVQQTLNFGTLMWDSADISGEFHTPRLAAPPPYFRSDFSEFELFPIQSTVSYNATTYVTQQGVVPQVLIAATNAVQQLYYNYTPTSGQFQLAYPNPTPNNPPLWTTSLLDWDASASDIQAALNAASGGTNFSCSGGILPTEVNITFIGKYANSSQTLLIIQENTSFIQIRGINYGNPITSTWEYDNNRALDHLDVRQFSALLNWFSLLNTLHNWGYTIDFDRFDGLLAAVETNFESATSLTYAATGSPIHVYQLFEQVRNFIIQLAHDYFKLPYNLCLFWNASLTGPPPQLRNNIGILDNWDFSPANINDLGKYGKYSIKDFQSLLPVYMVDTIPPYVSQYQETKNYYLLKTYYQNDIWQLIYDFSTINIGEMGWFTMDGIPYGENTYQPIGNFNAGYISTILQHYVHTGSMSGSPVGKTFVFDGYIESPPVIILYNLGAIVNQVAIGAASGTVRASYNYVKNPAATYKWAMFPINRFVTNFTLYSFGYQALPPSGTIVSGGSGSWAGQPNAGTVVLLDSVTYTGQMSLSVLNGLLNTLYGVDNDLLEEQADSYGNVMWVGDPFAVTIPAHYDPAYTNPNVPAQILYVGYTLPGGVGPMLVRQLKAPFIAGQYWETVYQVWPLLTQYRQDINSMSIGDVLGGQVNIDDVTFGNTTVNFNIASTQIIGPNSNGFFYGTAKTFKQMFCFDTGGKTLRQFYGTSFLNTTLQNLLINSVVNYYTRVPGEGYFSPPTLTTNIQGRITITFGSVSGPIRDGIFENVVNGPTYVITAGEGTGSIVKGSTQKLMSDILGASGTALLQIDVNGTTTNIHLTELISSAQLSDYVPTGNVIYFLINYELLGADIGGTSDIIAAANLKYNFANTFSLAGSYGVNFGTNADATNPNISKIFEIGSIQLSGNNNMFYPLTIG